MLYLGLIVIIIHILIDFFCSVSNHEFVHLNDFYYHISIFRNCNCK